MALATREQVNEAVDARFFEKHPDAPRKLDPNDPAQAGLVANWLEIRDQLVNEWTDQYFFGFFPGAPAKLNSSDPADADLIAYWNDIHHQLLTGEPGHWSWDSAPTATAATAAELAVVSVEANPGRTGFIVTFSRPTDVLEVEAFLWPTEPHLPVGCGVEVNPGASQAIVQTTVAALTTMRPDVANAMAQVGILTADEL